MTIINGDIAHLERQIESLAMELSRVRLQWGEERRIGRIADESRIELQRKAFATVIELTAERDDLAYQLKITQEKGRCQCADDDACAFAKERDALRVAAQSALDALEQIDSLAQVPPNLNGNSTLLQSHSYALPSIPSFHEPSTL
jgi:hypothetical protein